MEFIYGFYYGFDPLYLMITVGIMLVSMVVQSRLKSTFQQYTAMKNSKNLTGAEVARLILDHHGLQDVAVEHISGQLSDHYDPRDRVVRLSDSNFSEKGVASLAVAAHECGHAIQHKEHYSMLVLRGKMFPAVSFSSQLAPFLLMIGLGLAVYSNSGAPSALVLLSIVAGLVLFAVTVLFHFVTLPVEFDASKRAMTILESMNLLDESEVEAGKKVLNAAAMTYIVAALAALSQLFYFLLRASSALNRD